MEGHQKTPEQVLAELDNVDLDFSMLNQPAQTESPQETKAETETVATETKTEEIKTEQKPDPSDRFESEVRGMINGEIAVNFADIILSRLFAVGSKLAGIETNYLDFKLDEREKKQIAPFLERWINETGWFKKLTPAQQLLIVVGVVYSFKFSEVWSKQEERTEKKSAKRKPKESSVSDAEIVTTDGRPYSKETHFLNGTPKKKAQ